MEEHKKQKEQPKEQITDEAAELKKKCEEYLNGWKRERADFLNYKKEEVERIGQMIKYANARLILNVLPILDNIYLAESHVPEEFKDNNWIEGFMQIKKQLEDFLVKEGIEAIKAIGEKFDPSFMEAAEEAEDKDKEPGTVIEEVLRGYTMQGRVIRPAKVKISK